MLGSVGVDEGLGRAARREARHVQAALAIDLGHGEIVAAITPAARAGAVCSANTSILTIIVRCVCVTSYIPHCVYSQEQRERVLQYWRCCICG